MDRHEEPHVEEVLLRMPPGLVYGVSPSQAQIRDDQSIALTAAGLQECPHAYDDLKVFVSAVRHAAALERGLEFGERVARLSAEAVSKTIDLPAAGRDQALARLGAILKVEPWGWTSYTGSASQWSFDVDRRVRRFRDVSSIEDYLARTRTTGVVGDAPQSDLPEQQPSQEATSPLSIFISYAHEDKEVANVLARALKRLGVRVWIDQGELRAGDSIIERISRAIADVHFVAALVSRHSVASGWCQKELALAQTSGIDQRGVRVLPLRLDHVEMPLSLADMLYLRVDRDDPAAVVPDLIRSAESHQSEHRRSEG